MSGAGEKAGRDRSEAAGGMTIHEAEHGSSRYEKALVVFLINAMEGTRSIEAQCHPLPRRGASSHAGKCAILA